MSSDDELGSSDLESEASEEEQQESEASEESGAFPEPAAPAAPPPLAEDEDECPLCWKGSGKPAGHRGKHATAAPKPAAAEADDEEPGECPKCYKGSGKPAGHIGKHRIAAPKAAAADAGEGECPLCWKGSGKQVGHKGRHSNAGPKPAAAEVDEEEPGECPKCYKGSGKPAGHIGKHRVAAPKTAAERAPKGRPPAGKQWNGSKGEFEPIPGYDASAPKPKRKAAAKKKPKRAAKAKASKKASKKRKHDGDSSGSDDDGYGDSDDDDSDAAIGYMSDASSSEESEVSSDESGAEGPFAPRRAASKPQGKKPQGKQPQGKKLQGKKRSGARKKVASPKGKYAEEDSEHSSDFSDSEQEFEYDTSVVEWGGQRVQSCWGWRKRPCPRGASAAAANRIGQRVRLITTEGRLNATVVCKQPKARAALQVWRVDHDGFGWDEIEEHEIVAGLECYHKWQNDPVEFLVKWKTASFRGAKMMNYVFKTRNFVFKMMTRQRWNGSRATGCTATRG